MWMGTISPKAVTFLWFVCLCKGRQRNQEDVSGNKLANRSEAFGAIMISHCTVQKISDDNRFYKARNFGGWRKMVFESDEITNKEPIVYEKK